LIELMARLDCNQQPVRTGGTGSARCRRELAVGENNINRYSVPKKDLFLPTSESYYSSDDKTEQQRRAGNKQQHQHDVAGGVGSHDLSSSSSSGRSKQKEREARSLELEKAYVHEVYDQISGHFSDARYRPWPRIKSFLLDLDPGSLVCDVGEWVHSFTQNGTKDNAV
jgi:hypothetical protein